MKTKHLLTDSSHRRSWAIALIAVCLAASSGLAQDAGGRSSDTVESPRPTAYDRSATTTAQASTSDSSLKRTDKRFVTKAAESSGKEIAISQLAAQRATNPQVRSYAQQLVSEHQRMNRELVQLAQRKGVEVEPAHAAPGGGTSRDATTSTSTDRSTNSGIATTQGAPRATGAAGTSNTGAETGVATNRSTATSGPDTMGNEADRGDHIPADAMSDRHYRRLAEKSGAEFDREYVELIVDHHQKDVELFEKAASDAQDSEVRAFASEHLPALQAHLEQASLLKNTAAAAAE